MGCGAATQSKYDPHVVRVAEKPPEGPGVAKVEASKPSNAPGSDGFKAAREAMHVGAAVRLCNLKAQPELNGAVGTVVSYDPAADRWTVRLDTGQEKAVRVDNVQVAPLKVGCYVRITGLKADSALNGMVGIVEALEPITGRWTVKLSGGVKKALKVDNLVALQRDRAPSKDTGEGHEDTAEVTPVREYRPGPYEVLEGSPLHMALQAGSLRLVRGSYFERRAKEEKPWQKRQEISDDDLWTPSEAAQLWARYGCTFLLAFSYSWLSREHSDPEMWHLKRLARAVKEWRGAAAAQGFRERLCPMKGGASGAVKGAPTEAPPDVGVFVDFCCFHQRPGGGSAREDTHYHACMEVMGVVYGHEHTSVLRCTTVPGRIDRKYFHRGWTAFESCIAGNKAYPDDKLYEFDDTYNPENEPLMKQNFLRKFKMRQIPPVSYERFTELLWRLEEEVKTLRVPYNRLFTQAEDKSFAVNKFREAWDEQRLVRELDLKNMGWEDAEALQLSALLPMYCHLETLHLTGNKIGDAGAEAILGALSETKLCSLDLSDNRIGQAGAAAMAGALPAAPHLSFMYAFANPFCGTESARWQLTTAWKAAGKAKENLVLDHFALSHKNQKP